MLASSITPIYDTQWWYVRRSTYTNKSTPMRFQDLSISRQPTPVKCARHHSSCSSPPSYDVEEYPMQLANMQRNLYLLWGLVFP